MSINSLSTHQLSQIAIRDFVSFQYLHSGSSQVRIPLSCNDVVESTLIALPMPPKIASHNCSFWPNNFYILIFWGSSSLSSSYNYILGKKSTWNVKTTVLKCAKHTNLKSSAVLLKWRETNYSALVIRGQNAFKGKVVRC